MSYKELQMTHRWMILLRACFVSFAAMEMSSHDSGFETKASAVFFFLSNLKKRQKKSGFEGKRNMSGTLQSLLLVICSHNKIPYHNKQIFRAAQKQSPRGR